MLSLNTIIWIGQSHMPKKALIIKQNFICKYNVLLNKMDKCVSQPSKQIENEHTWQATAAGKSLFTILLLKNLQKTLRGIKLNSRKSSTMQPSSFLFGCMLLHCVGVIKALTSGKFQCIHMGQFRNSYPGDSSTKNHSKQVKAPQTVFRSPKPSQKTLMLCHFTQKGKKIQRITRYTVRNKGIEDLKRATIKRIF